MRRSSLVYGLLIILSLSTFEDVSTPAHFQAGLKSHGVISDSPVYHGVVVNIFKKGGSLTDEDFQKLRSWNLNAIQYNIRWFEIEPHRDQPEVYDENNLALLREYVDKASDYGLRPFLSICPVWGTENQSYHGWSGGVEYHDYINVNPDGRQRYVNLIRMLARRLEGELEGFCPWQFPYHRNGGTFSSNDRDTYNTVTFPAFIEAIRSEDSDVWIIFDPCLQGIARVGGRYLLAGQYSFIKQPFSDSKVMYDVNIHDYIYGPIYRGEKTWDRDETGLWEMWQPLIDFKNTHNVRTICIEAICLFIHTQSTRDRPINPTRLDWVHYTFEVMESLQMSWMYHRYESLGTWSINPANPLESDGSDSEVASIIAEFAGRG